MNNTLLTFGKPDKGNGLSRNAEALHLDRVTTTQEQEVVPNTKRPTQHRNVQRLDRPTRTGAPTRVDVEEEEYKEENPPRTATVQYRYDTGNGVLPTQGRRTRVEKHYHDQPYDAERQTTYDYEKVAPPRPRTRGRQKLSFHWLFFVGIGLLLMLAGYIALNVIGAWWQVHQDDVTYGNPRTFQIDAVVGHFDSEAHPTHFIALNLKGQVIVIELPGGDVSRARSYDVTTIPDNSSNPPVKLVFQDLTRNGKMDMVIEIGDPGSQVTLFLYNNGSQFVPKL